MKNKSIKKISNSTINLYDKSSFATRAIADLERSNHIEKLTEEMVILFKTAQYQKCERVCKKILNFDNNIIIVNLLFATCRNRIRKLKKIR